MAVRNESKSRIQEPNSAKYPQTHNKSFTQNRNEPSDSAVHETAHISFGIRATLCHTSPPLFPLLLLLVVFPFSFVCNIISSELFYLPINASSIWMPVKHIEAERISVFQGFVKLDGVRLQADHATLRADAPSGHLTALNYWPHVGDRVPCERDLTPLAVMSDDGGKGRQLKWVNNSIRSRTNQTQNHLKWWSVRRLVKLTFKVMLTHQLHETLTKPCASTWTNLTPSETRSRFTDYNVSVC